MHAFLLVMLHRHLSESWLDRVNAHVVSRGSFERHLEGRPNRSECFSREALFNDS